MIHSHNADFEKIQSKLECIISDFVIEAIGDEIFDKFFWSAEYFTLSRNDIRRRELDRINL